MKPVLGKRGAKGVSLSYEYEYEHENTQKRDVKEILTGKNKRRASSKSTAHSSGAGSTDF